MSRLLLVTYLAQAALAELTIPNAHIQVKDVSDPGATACSIADKVVSYCGNIPGITDAPLATREACLCCVSTTLIDPVYSLCASYVAASFPASDSTLASELVTVASACALAGTAVCGLAAGGGGGGGGSSPSTTPPAGGFSPSASATPAGPASSTVPPADTTAAPPACSSAGAYLQSCSSKLGGFTDKPDAQIASCICGSGSSYTTDFDAQVASCAIWAKTGDPTDFSVFAPLATFCAANSPAAGNAGNSVATGGSFPTATGNSFGSAGGSKPSSTVTVTPGPTASGRQGSAAHHIVSGPATWLGSILSVFLCFVLFL